MHIIVKNKKLYIDNYNVKCAIGKRGIGNKIKEGDYITPKGKYRIKSILYRKDRVPNLKSNMNKIIIKKNMGWCNDPRSKKYNMLIKFPYRFKAERLHRNDNVYDIILVLDFNTNPVRKGKGSAIFIHIAKKNYKKTDGCVAVNKRNLKEILKRISSKTKVKII